MKKLFKILIFVLIGVNICACATQASLALSKALDKEYKQKLKEYKKGGWKVDSDRSTEVVILKHLNKLEAYPDLKVITGTSTNCKSTNVCKQVALNNAQNEYARLVSGKIEGAFATIIKANANRPQEEIDKMTGGLINEVKADLSKVLEPSYSIYREKGGLKEYKTFFFVNEAALIGNLEIILEKSIKETKLTIEEARAISKFVGDELRKESSIETGIEGE